jgi:hypothetical protein
MRSITGGRIWPDCVIEVLAAPGATRALGPEELSALRVLADAGMVSPVRYSDTGAVTLPAPKSWAFPATKAS